MASRQDSDNPAIRHHYVPKALLRPWLVGESQNNLTAFWWNHRSGQLDRKYGGLKSFGYRDHLFTLGPGQTSPDALEKVFFGHIDDRGAKIRDKLLGQDRLSLDADERCDFARLLMSLDARRPENVAKLRASTETMRSGLDLDPKVGAALAAEGYDMPPSQFVEKVLNHSFDDGALLIIQRIVDNPEIGPRLINMHWQVKHIGNHDGKMILSDRPLIQIGGIDDPNTAWAMPLTPTCAFVACASRYADESVRRLTGQRFCKLLNVDSARQADRFAFTVDDGDARWLGRYLRRPASGKSGLES